MNKQTRKKLHKILGTVKYADETWVDTFERINKQGAMDIKTVYHVLGVVLDELDGKERD